MLSPVTRPGTDHATAGLALDIAARTGCGTSAAGRPSGIPLTAISAVTQERSRSVWHRGTATRPQSAGTTTFLRPK